MKAGKLMNMLLCSLLIFVGCANDNNFPEQEVSEPMAESVSAYTRNTPIDDVINDAAFGDYGRLIFPTQKGYYGGNTLGELSLTWYSHIDPDMTVEIANYFKSHAESGDKIFYDIYSDEEKAADPEKNDTGLFFFRGTAGARFAVCNAGGAFAYVGAMQDSFPHALELSRKGYNAFALIYRPDAQKACEDLARAVSFIFENADELEVDTDCYSLWGGSAGAVIMQYTGLSQYSESDPPTFVCVGDSDGIANWQIMQARLDAMNAVGIDTEFHCYHGLGHGFGLGTGTEADGWIDDAVRFWEKQMIN